MAQKYFIWVKTGIFYEFSKWREIEIQKPITESQKLPKRNRLSVVSDGKPGLRSLGVTASRVVTTINACEGRNNA